MKHCLCRAFLHNPSGEAPVGAPWGNNVSHPLSPPVRVRHTLSGQRENAGAGLYERSLDNVGTLGSAGHPCRRAAVCPAVLVGQFNTSNTGEGPGIWTADVDSSR